MHMDQSVEEEVFTPGCFESFAPSGGFVGDAFEDIGREAAQERKISRAIVFAVSGEVFVEDYVLLPMTAVFDVQMTSDDLQKIEWSKAAGRYEQPLLARGFAIEGTLGCDPCHRGQTLEPMRGSKPGRSHDEDRSSFLPAMALLRRLGRSAVRSGRIEKRRNARQQFTLVELERDDIVAAPSFHRLNRAAVAMDGIGGNPPAPERHTFKTPVPPLPPSPPAPLPLG